MVPTENALALLLKRSSKPDSQCSVKAWLRGSAVSLLSAFILAGCSGSEPEPESAGTPPRASLVSTAQYFNTLRYVFGSSIDLQVEFPPFERKEGLLANGAAIAGVSSSQLEQFQAAGTTVAAQVVGPTHREFLLPCKPANPKSADEACATEFLSQTGRLLVRRPLTDTELNTLVDNAGMGADKLEDFYEGLEIALEALLLSPEVLFVVEHAEADPDNPGQLRLDAYSLASRLSYFLWDAAPDAELLDAAESGELQTESGLAREVDRMLASPRLVAGMRAFFGDMFHFSDFQTLAKDPTIYPNFTGVTAAAAQEQTLRTVINHLLTENKDYRDLFTTRDTFMTRELAIQFDMPAGPGWVPYTLPADSPRAGLLTQVSFLSLHSHPGRSSPTLRGMALRELLLCQVVPAAPASVDFSVINNPDSHYPTQRDRVNAHLETPSCAGCHRIMDPIGLTLESFDGEGRYRTTENGVPIDTTGSLDGVEYSDAIGLAHALRDNPGLPGCLVQRVFAYGTGGPVQQQDRAYLEHMTEAFKAEGYQLRDLLRSIVLSDAFAKINEPQASPPAGQNDEGHTATLSPIIEETLAASGG
ncbi:hypothetical protein BA177_00215 [Woeseia oceani]|uniref:DUF1592 domain-containing protein n=1 Tax=Woeseia oceani TaxID=1548547 RepID=A0A193LKE6_9GAMM|nr:hypothetical protein BA177_00215 [Woeseia oceani]